MGAHGPYNYGVMVRKSNNVSFHRSRVISLVSEKRRYDFYSIVPHGRLPIENIDFNLESQKTIGYQKIN